MQHIDIVVPCESNSVHYLTMLGCVHLESALHYERLFDQLIDERAQLPNHRFGILGDFFSAIIAGDQKRYTAHETNPAVAARTDYHNAALDLARRKLKRVADQLDMAALGNHEWTVIQKYGFDPISALIDTMRTEGSPVQWGGYCGLMTYHYTDKEYYEKYHKPHHAVMSRHLWHHGVTAGGKGKGIIPTVEWTRQQPEFDIAWFAHSHSMVIYPDPKGKQSRAKWKDGQVMQRTMKHKTRWIVNTGTFQKTYNDHDKLPDFGERGGHPLRHIGAPLAIIKPVLGHGIKVDVICSTETGVIK